MVCVCVCVCVCVESWTQTTHGRTDAPCFPFLYAIVYFKLWPLKQGRHQYSAGVSITRRQQAAAPREH